jgi:L-ascorbate metabolism protein UlaG (beta-lactamase superfamily)
VGQLLRGRRFEHVLEIDVGESLSFGSLTVTATHADHEGGRGPLRTSGPALGYLITGSRRLYFAGDTDLFDDMALLAETLDVAFVPIWGWGRTLGRGRHMDPERAAAALALLKPRIAVPIHWGTYHPLYTGLLDVPEFLRDPPEAFVLAAAEVVPGVEVRVLAPGDSLEL